LLSGLLLNPIVQEPVANFCKKGALVGLLQRSFWCDRKDRLILHF